MATETLEFVKDFLSYVTWEQITGMGGGDKKKGKIWYWSHESIFFSLLKQRKVFASRKCSLIVIMQERHISVTVRLLNKYTLLCLSASNAANTKYLRLMARTSSHGGAPRQCLLWQTEKLLPPRWRENGNGILPLVYTVTAAAYRRGLYAPVKLHC
jgi:hypothetical protein